MKEQVEIRKRLRASFQAAKVQNARYSQSSFAKKLGIHSSTLSYILKGKRFVSRDMAEKLLRSLGLDPQERSELLALFPLPRSQAVTEEQSELPPRYRKIDLQTFQKIFEWEYFAFLSLLKCVDFSSNRDWLAQRLAVSPAKIEEIIQNLISVGMLTEENGKMKRIEEFRTPDDIPAESIRKHHLQTLALAQRSIQTHPVEARDFSSMTFAIDPKFLPQAKEKIRLFQDEIMDEFAAKKATEVYRLSVELFPLTSLSVEVAV